ncbi:MAG: hypothetical protein D3910_21585 [Candidatus Electrothrix sp. ATG2]|nr:hypothetical protein [Candidatus Electrothrix sp. ATG2]
MFLVNQATVYRQEKVSDGRPPNNCSKEKKVWYKKRLLRRSSFSYGEVAGQRQGEIIRDLATPQTNAPTGADDIAEAVFRKLRKAGLEA